MPGQSYRSKLNPHFSFIRDARLREETWEEIARQIGERGTATDRSQVCKFFQRRMKGKTPVGFAPPGAGEAATPAPPPAKQAPPPDDLEDAPARKLKLKVS